MCHEVTSPAGAHGGRTPIRRAARGSISRTACGSLRVRVYAGKDPITGRQRWLSQNIAAGPAALEDAEAACRRMLTVVREQRHPRVDVTLTELLDRHLAMMHASETSRRSYRWTVAKHVGPLLGHLRLAAITPETLDIFYAELLRCRDHCPYPQDEHECQPLSPATVRKIHYLISGAYRRAVRWGWIDRSPTRDAEPPGKPHPEPQPPTPAEAARILDAAWADPDLGPLAWLAMVTGARRGELCALRWRHADLARQVVVIRASIAQNGADMWEKDTKLHQRRHLTLDPDTVAVLTAYHQARHRRAAAGGVALADESFVFSARADGASWRPPASLTRQYHRLVREADQRACLALRDRLPTPRVPPTARPIPDARPPSPYQTIATELRAAIHTGTLSPGTPLPTVQQLAIAHHVAPSTAHRAITQLAGEHLITVTRGRRAIANSGSLER